MQYIQYKYCTLMYILFISIISHLPIDSLPESSSSFSNQDKIFHFIEFFILGLLLQLSFLESKKFSTNKIIFMTIIFGFIIACFDELHQNFVQGRQPSIDDLIFDFFGLILSFINYKNFY
mgnify:CR=1 FL=1